MTQRAQSLFRLMLLWSCAGVGFNLAQRVLDHFIDIAADNSVWLAWLK